MAVCTHAVTTPDTGASPNTSGAFTPVANDLLVVWVQAGNSAEPTATLTNSAGLTFTRIGQALYGTSAHSLYLFVANALAAASSQTVTADMVPDGALGTAIGVMRVSGMTRTGSSAVLQFAKEENKVGGNTPAPVFGASAQTGNPTLGAVANLTNPATITPPTSWTEAADVGYASPTCGLEHVFRDSGFTGTTITWGSTFGTQGASFIVELDTSAVPAGGFNPRRTLMGVGREPPGQLLVFPNLPSRYVRDRRSGLVLPQHVRRAA